MKIGALKLLFILIIVVSPEYAGSQNVFVLEKPGKMKIYMYRENDLIQLRLKSGGQAVSGKISKISDSSIVINQRTEILTENIEAVVRKPWGFNLIQGIFLGSGLLYLTLSGLNGVINNDNPVIPSETMYIGGSLIAAGILVYPLTRRTCKIEKEKWRIKILDFSD